MLHEAAFATFSAMTGSIKEAVETHANTHNRWDWEYGLRVDDQLYPSGFILPPSVRFGDDGDADTILRGTSAIAIGDAERIHADRVHLLDSVAYRNIHGKRRTYLTLLVARRYDEGEDAHEGVFRNAVVVAQWPTESQMKATLLETAQQAADAGPGIYAVHSGSGAYFPVMAMLEAGYAVFRGEVYDDRGRMVTVEVTTAPHPSMRVREGERRTITIGAQFFITALKDYNDWPIKWWREAVQNSVDGGGKNIALSAHDQDDGTKLVSCDDDGRGMDEDTIVNKFLVLGGTTKIGAGGAAGGFGKAKELLLLPWISWRVHSRDTIVEGAGIDYTVTRGPMRQGTRLDVVMPPDKCTTDAVALGFLQKCDLPGIRFTVNGEPARADLRGANLVNQVPDKADIYFTPADSKQSYMYVRTRGLYMFSNYIGEVPGFVLVELIAPSIEILTANRDGFRDYGVSSAIEKLAEKIAKDNISALKSKAGLIRQKFEGTGKFHARERAARVLEQVGSFSVGELSTGDADAIIHTMSSYARGEEEKLQSTPSAAVAHVMLDQRFLGPNHLEAAVKQLVWEPDWFLVNEVEGFKVPKKFYPESMTPTVLKLAKTWTELCRYVMMQLGSEEHFGVGFVFSEDAGAQAITDEDREGNTEKWIMLNPFKDVHARNEIWRPAQDQDLKWLYAAAIHECTHIADRISYHDESFARALTNNMAKCADGYRKIRQIAAGIRSRGAPETD